MWGANSFTSAITRESRIDVFGEIFRAPPIDRFFFQALILVHKFNGNNANFSGENSGQTGS